MNKSANAHAFPEGTLDPSLSPALGVTPRRRPRERKALPVGEGQIAELGLLVGGALLVFIAALLLSAALAFAAGASLSRLNLLLAAIAVTGFVGWATRRDVAGPRATVRVVVAMITAGCGPGLYCPNDPTTRGQMAVFLTTTFNLP